MVAAVCTPGGCHGSSDWATNPRFNTAKGIGNRRGGIGFATQVAGGDGIESFVGAPMPIIVLPPHQCRVGGMFQAAVVRTERGAIICDRALEALNNTVRSV